MVTVEEASIVNPPETTGTSAKEVASDRDGGAANGVHASSNDTFSRVGYHLLCT
jgi:hypothetical protein